MAEAIKILTKYIILPGTFAYGLMSIFKPSEAEIQEIKNKSSLSYQYTEVLRAAASPASKPMYRQATGEQHPKPDLAAEIKKIKE